MLPILSTLIPQRKNNNVFFSFCFTTTLILFFVKKINRNIVNKVLIPRRVCVEDYRLPCSTCIEWSENPDLVIILFIVRESKKIFKFWCFC
jgi:hypothetical protein